MSIRFHSKRISILDKTEVEVWKTFIEKYNSSFIHQKIYKILHKFMGELLDQRHLIVHFQQVYLAI